MKTTFLKDIDWEKAAEDFGFKDDRIPKKLDEIGRMEQDAYQDGIQP